MLSAALRGNIRNGALENLQKRLLHALAGNVTRDGDVLALSGDLVDLVDVDDAHLRLGDVVVRRLDELQKDVLDVVADVARLGERGCVRHGERHVEDFRKRLREQRFAAARRSEHDDVALLQFDVVGLVAHHADALVVVVHRDGKRLFRVRLPDHVLIERSDDLRGLRDVFLRICALLVVRLLVAHILLHDLTAQLDALVADIHIRTRNQLADLAALLAAEAAAYLIEIVSVSCACHSLISSVQ